MFLFAPTPWLGHRVGSGTSREGLALHSVSCSIAGVRQFCSHLHVPIISCALVKNYKDFCRPIYKVQNPQRLVAKNAKQDARFFSPQDVEPVLGWDISISVSYAFETKNTPHDLGDFPGKTKKPVVSLRQRVVFGCPPQSPCYMRKSTLKIDRYCFLVMQGFSKFSGLFFQWVWQTPLLGVKLTL